MLLARFEAVQQTATKLPRVETRSGSPYDSLPTDLLLGRHDGLPASATAGEEDDRTAPEKSSGHLSVFSDVSGGELLSLTPEASATAQLQHTAISLLRSPLEELEFTRSSIDPTGTRHVRMQQVYRDVPVYGAEVILHQPTRGAATVTGRVRLTPKLAEAAPTLSADDALRLLSGDQSSKPVHPDPLVASIQARLHDAADLYYVEFEGRYRASPTSPKPRHR